MRILSAIGTVMRGSLGGITATANQFQNIILRARVSPVNPNTTKQTASRTAFDGAVAAWKTISQAFRDGWNDYAATLSFSGPTGDYTITGRLAFIRSLQPALYLQGQVGVPAIVAFDPPIISGALNVQGVILSTFAGAADTGVALTFTTEASEDIIGYAERSFSFDASRERFKGPFLSDSIEFTSLVAPGSGIIEFGGLTEGKRYFMNPRFITALAPFRLSSRSFLNDLAITNI